MNNFTKGFATSRSQGLLGWKGRRHHVNSLLANKNIITHKYPYIQYTHLWNNSDIMLLLFEVLKAKLKQASNL